MSEDKKIFEYVGRDGETLHGDPVAIRWKLAKLLGGSPEKALMATKSRDPAVALQAMDRLRSAVCIAFDLGDPFDLRTGQGVLQETWHGAVKNFLKWCRETRHFFRADADLAAAYGILPEPFDYRARVGLYLNLPRTWNRLAMLGAEGNVIANSRARIAEAYFDSVELTPAEGEEQESEANSSRQMAAARSRRHR